MPLQPTKLLYENSRCQIYKGTDRIAIVGNKFTLKLPVTNPRQFYKNATSKYERYGFSAVYRDLKDINVEGNGLKYWLFRGVHENRREARIAKKYPDIVAPTKTLLGLLNVQHTLSPIHSSESEVWNAFANQLHGRTPILGHMMENTQNLGIHHNDQVVFVDGGSSGLDKLLPQKYNEIVAALGTIATNEGALRSN